jgi:hypothetical protein
LAGSSGWDNGDVSAARFASPAGLTIDSSENFYVSEQTGTIRKITPAGLVSTVAGSPRTTGTADGVGTAARFTWPDGLAADPVGNVYVADSGNHIIRKITPAGVASTVAGLPGGAGSADGAGGAARFNLPVAVALNSAGDMYVCDSRNNTIRGGVPTTFALWQNMFFSQQQLNDPTISGDAADPDHDGLPNLLERGFNLNPLLSSAYPALDAALGANYLSVIYTKVVGAADLTYSIEKSADLTQWSLASPTNLILSDNGVTQTIEARVPVTPPSTKLFLQVRVAH